MGKLEKIFCFEGSYKKPVSFVFFNFKKDMQELVGSARFIFSAFLDSPVNPFFCFLFLSGIEQFSDKPYIIACSFGFEFTDRNNLFRKPGFSQGIDKPVNNIIPLPG